MKIEPQFPLPWALCFRINNLFLFSPHGFSYLSVTVTDIDHFSGFPAFESISKIGKTPIYESWLWCISRISFCKWKMPELTKLVRGTQPGLKSTCPRLSSGSREVKKQGWGESILNEVESNGNNQSGFQRWHSCPLPGRGAVKGMARRAWQQGVISLVWFLALFWLWSNAASFSSPACFSSLALQPS